MYVQDQAEGENGFLRITLSGPKTIRSTFWTTMDEPSEAERGLQERMEARRGRPSGLVRLDGAKGDST